MEIVKLKNVSFSYDAGANFVLQNCSLSICEGEHVVVTGRNGAGKSTLAKLVAGLLSPDAGKVQLFGDTCFDEGKVFAENYSNARKKIAYVSQDSALQLICENVATDIAFPLQNLNFSAEKIDEAVLIQLEKAGLEEIADADPATLSGGQQQLVVLASAIASDPELLVLDEPTSFLDEENTFHFLRLLKKTAGNRTIFHVAHKQAEIASGDIEVRLYHD